MFFVSSRHGILSFNIVIVGKCAFYFYFTQYLLCFNFSLAAFNIFLLSVSLCVLLICLYLCFQKILNLWFDFYYNLRKLLDRISSASLFFLQNLNDMYRFHWLCSHSCSPAPGLHHWEWFFFSNIPLWSQFCLLVCMFVCFVLQ